MTVTGLMKDDVTIVTGAARGIGRAISQGLAAAGAKVALCDLNETGLAETAALIRADGGIALAITPDITDLVRCKTVAAQVEAKLGPASVLVNNAGVLLVEPVGAPGYAQAWDTSFAVNVGGAMNIVTAFVDQLRRTKGRIVNLSSTSAFLGSHQSSIYGATKGAVVQLTRSLAVELGPEGIRVNGIAPGHTLIDIAADTTNAKEPNKAYMRRTPLQEIGRPTDMVGPVIFLASAMSGHVTGVTIPVDGGYLATGMMSWD